MHVPNRRSHFTLIPRGLALGLFACVPLLVGTTACVTENLDTGEMVPRGNQRYPWDKVKEYAKQLKNGMNKAQVMMLMGSPAELDDEGTQWIYLPERYGIIVPAEALRLEFKDTILTDFGYQPIILGARL